MTTPNTDITALSAVANFQTLITNPINAIAGKWSTSNNPSGVAYPGYPTLSAVPTTLTSVLLDGDTISSSPGNATYLLTGNIDLATFRAVLQAAASVLSQCRYVTLNKYYVTGATNNWYYSGSNYAHLNSSYAMSSFPTPVASGDISATALDNYVVSVQNAIAVWRGTTVTFSEYWCHSNCHSNHSSRGRR